MCNIDMNRIDQIRFRAIIEQATRDVLNEQQQLNEAGLFDAGKALLKPIGKLLGIGAKGSSKAANIARNATLALTPSLIDKTFHTSDDAPEISLAYQSPYPYQGPHPFRYNSYAGYYNY